MIGVECPRPGTGTFQTMPSVSLQRSGASPTAMPVLSGPRHCIHPDVCDAGATEPAMTSAATNAQPAQLS